jgi:signal transduction histidine kinase
MKTIEYFSKMPPVRIIIGGFSLIIIVGFFDYITGPEISFSIFYLIPISLVALIVGTREGILVSLFGAFVWLAADLLSGHHYSSPAIPYWNATVRFGFFLIVTFSLSTLTSAQKRREELVHFVVHDLRAPLANVISGLQGIQHFGAKTLDTTVGDFVRICLTSSNRMMTLIQSILDLTRFESGKMPLEQARIPLQELIESSLESVSVWAKMNRVTLTFQRDPATESIYADRAVTERIFVNLLSNAIKFSKPESTITVSVRPRRSDMVEFSVSDQGKGIAKEWADKVFDKFEQADISKSTGRSGTGLGLSFCRLAVEAQGGRIWLESEVNVGTTITFSLPRIGGAHS